MRLLLAQANLSTTWLVALPTLAAIDWRTTLIVTLALATACSLTLISVVMASESAALLALRFNATFQRQARRIVDLERRLRGSDSADAREAAQLGRRNVRLRRVFRAARDHLRRCEFSLKTTQGALVGERDARKQAEAAAAMWRQMYEREHAKQQDKDSSSTG